MNIEQTTTVAIASLLAEQRIPALDERQYQELTQHLFSSADSPLRLDVAEAVLRHARQHPQALGLFLSCICPLAEKAVRRLFEKMFPQPPDLTRELLYNGAINGAIRLFQRHGIRNEIPFRPVLYCAFKTGAMQAAFHRTENRAICSIGSVDHHASGPRVEEQLMAREMLEKIAALEPKPDTARIYRFLRCLVNMGPDALRASAYEPKRRYGRRQAGAGRNRSPQLRIDLEPIMKELGISHWAARQYLSQAREMLRQLFDADGTLFIKSAPRSR
jgi:hypothetical protein